MASSKKKIIGKPVKQGTGYELSVEFKTGFKDENLVNNSTFAYKLIQAILDKRKITEQEQILALFMSATFKKIAYSSLSIGADSFFPNNVKLISSFAQHTKASAVVIALHRPGGSLKPSQSDFALTLVIKDTLLRTGIKLVDLLIVNDVGYYSMHDEGFLKARK